ncbi:MAG: DUF5702 domain-containing protein, partial [Eubacterium sp.]|nr:DUF5702 domain-containing protein [Eubacterium sp.]
FPMHLKVLILTQMRLLVRKNGSITVMLSLVGLVVFAMLGTCVETARFAACKRQATQIIQTSTSALLTEYSRPLYDHYGFFFLESGGIPYERVIARYASDSMRGNAGYMSFMTGELSEVKVKDKTCAGDDEAAPLQKEINEYMKREVTSELLGKTLSKLGLLKSTEDEAKQLEDTVEEQKEDTKLDNHIVKLMCLVDGVRLSKGKIRTVSNFAKKFALEKEIKGEDFGVMQQSVWKKMKKNIDKTPAKWDKTDAAFRKNLKSAADETKKAIEEGKKLKATYSSASSHSDMAARVISGLDSLDGNLKVLTETERILNAGGDKKELKSKLKSLWKDYDTTSLSFDYSGADGDEDEKNPLDSLGDGVEGGILKLVCEKPDKLSKKGIKNADDYAKYYKENPSEKKDFSDRAEKFAKDEDLKLTGVFEDVAGYALDEFSLDSYIQKKFPSYIEKAKDKDWKQPLKYGWEYIVSGDASDKENLESVVSRILLIRTVTNTGAILADSSKRAECYAAAAALVGITGLPFLIRFTQTLMIIAWGFVESLVDVAAILMERDVPVVKSSKSIKTTFPEIFLVTNSAITGRAKKYKKAGKTTFGYREYMLAFMAMTPAKIRRYRVMDLIDAGMKKNGYGGFSVGKSVFSMEVMAGFSFPSKFFRMPSISNIIGRDINTYETSCLIKSGYL